jgi:hypothetical protein
MGFIARMPHLPVHFVVLALAREECQIEAKQVTGFLSPKALDYISASTQEKVPPGSLIPTLDELKGDDVRGACRDCRKSNPSAGTSLLQGFAVHKDHCTILTNARHHCVHWQNPVDDDSRVPDSWRWGVSRSSITPRESCGNLITPICWWHLICIRPPLGHRGVPKWEDSGLQP